MNVLMKEIKNIREFLKENPIVKDDFTDPLMALEYKRTGNIDQVVTDVIKEKMFYCKNLKFWLENGRL